MNVQAKWDMGEREGGLTPTPHNPLNYLKGEITQLIMHCMSLLKLKTFNNLGLFSAPDEFGFSIC